MKLSTANRNILGATVVLVAAAGLAGFALWPAPTPVPSNAQDLHALPADPRMMAEVRAVAAGELRVAPLNFIGSANPTVGEEQVVAVTANTRVWRQVLRDRATFEAELARFKEDPSLGAPRPYTEQTLVLSDLVPGMWVTITPTEAGGSTAADVLVTREANFIE